MFLHYYHYYTTLLTNELKLRIKPMNRNNNLFQIPLKSYKMRRYAKIRKFLYFFFFLKFLDTELILPQTMFL